MLPVLKKAGVVDAGGRGLLVIFTGMQKMLLGEDIDINVEEITAQNASNAQNMASSSDSNDYLINLENLGDIEFVPSLWLLIWKRKQLFPILINFVKIY